MRHLLKFKTSFVVCYIIMSKNVFYFVCKILLLARAFGLKARLVCRTPLLARATIGYLVYNGQARAMIGYLNILYTIFNCVLQNYADIRNVS